MKTIYLVHGFRENDAQTASLSFLKEPLEQAGHKVVIVDYGYVHRLRVRLCNSRLAKMLASISESEAIAIGHSNGCDIIRQAADLGAFKDIILFNPALDSDSEFSEHLENISVFYSANDKATTVARWIPFSSWGNMGAVGYEGPDSRVIDFDEEHITGKEMGHSDFSEYPSYFVPLVKLLCED